MPFDPTQPFTVVEDEQAAPQGFDPNKPFEYIPEPEPSAFDPSKPFELLEEPQPAPGARYDVQSFAQQAAGRTAPGDVASAFVRGALSEGVLAGSEGAMRGAQAVSNAVSDRIARNNILGEEYAKLSGTLGELERAQMLGANPRRADQIAQVRGRLQAIEADKSAALGGAASVQGQQLKPLARTLSGARTAVREALPVSPEFEASLGGQIVSGLGQAVGTLPFYVLTGPVGGAALSVGQLYQEGYDDALSKGADEATANKAGMANVPASALDILADRFVVGRILKPLKGKMTVGQLARSVAVSAPVEGLTEGAQQAWQNVVARHIVGYDPARQLDDEVVNSIIVGAVVGGAVAGAGGMVTNRFAPQAPAGQPAPQTATTAAPPPAAGATSSAGAVPPPSAVPPPPAPTTPPAAATSADTLAAQAYANRTDGIILRFPPSASQPPPRPAMGPLAIEGGQSQQRDGAGDQKSPTTDAATFDLTPDERDRFFAIESEEQPVASNDPGITYSVRKDRGKIWLKAEGPATDGVILVAIAYLQVDANGKATLGGSFALPQFQQPNTPESVLAEAARVRLLSELNRIARPAQRPADTGTPPPPSAATTMAPSLPEGAPRRAAVDGSTGVRAGAEVPPTQETVKPMSRRQMAETRRQIKELENKAQRAAQTSPERAGEFTQQAQELRQKLAQAEANRPRGAAPAVGLGPDGNPDLLSDIAEYIGRIRTIPPEGNSAQGGEYDGWNDVLNEGAARLLRGRDQGMKPDEVVEALRNVGYKFQSVSEVQEAIRRAVAQRRKLGEEVRLEAYRNRVEDMARTDTRAGRRAELRPKEPTVIQNIGEGGSFTLNREKFSVVDVKDDPDNGETVYVIQDGHRFEVPYDTPIFADRDSIQPGKVDAAVDPFDFPAPDETPARSEKPASVQPDQPPPSPPTAAPSAASSVPLENRPLRSFPTYNRWLVKIFRTFDRDEKDFARRNAAGALRTYLTADEALDLQEIAQRYHQDFSGEAMARDLSPDQIAALDKRLLRRVKLHGLLQSAKIQVIDPVGAPYAEYANQPEIAKLGARIGETARVTTTQDGVVALLGVTLKAADVQRAAQGQATASPNPSQLFPESDMPFNLAGEEQQAQTAPQPATDQTPEMFGSETRSTPPTDMDRQNERQRGSRSGAMGSTPFGSPPPMAAPPTQPPRTAPPPAADPNFSQLPIELPEAVQFFNRITLGKFPKIRERLRALGGRAAGVFRYKEGQLDSGEIELRADQFNLLSTGEKQELLRQAVAWAKNVVGNTNSTEFREAVQSRFEELVKEAEEESIKAGPRRALAVFWHEIGHFLDFFPTATTNRGNILGRLASLNNYFKGYLSDRPGHVAEPPNETERRKLYEQAERELGKDIQTIVETIRREEPVYREIPITPEQITNIVKNAARSDYPDFYDWFAKLDRKGKADVLKQAMRGIVDPRVAQFTKREPTGETRVIEETVTRQTGTPPSPEQVVQRFKELFYAELERRGLVSATQIREELSRAIAWWRGVKEIPDYYKTSVEMWADAMSIFFNNPRGLAEQAPRFYASFMNWMAAKPGLRELYDKVQQDIASGQIYRDRVQNLRDSWKRDAEAAVLIDEANSKTTLASYVDYARLLIDRVFGPIESKIAAQPGKRGPATLAALGNYRYSTTAWEAYALDLRNQVEVVLAQAALSHDDLAEYMFHKRITEGARRELANPLGWNPKNSRERLAEMERDLGPQRWAALVEAQNAQRRVYQKHVIQPLHQAGVLSPALAEAIDSEFFYAPFNKSRIFTGANTDSIEALIKLNYGNDAAGAIYGQVGNLGEIRSPYVQMQHRAFGLMSMAYKQMALKSVVRYLQENDPLAVVEAPMRFNGRRLEARAINNDEVATLYVLDHGKVRAFYVKRIIAEMFSRGSIIEMRLAGAAHRILGLPKALLTELNPGFWPVAFVKDIANASIQLPTGAAVLQSIPRAYQAARATFTGKPDALATRVLDRMMVISRADNRGEHLGHADEMTRILMRLGKTPVAWNTEVGKIERVLTSFFAAWARQGQILERTVKIASMMAIDQRFPHLPEAEKQQMVRELGGSPDFQAKGRAARTIELMFGMMFFNAWKESVRSQFRAMKRDPRGYWGKFAGGVGAAAAVFWAFESGLLNAGGGEDEEDYRDQIRSIPERDKLRGFVVPLGWVDKPNGKVAYLVLPFPDNVRWAHALLRKSFQTAGGDPNKSEGIGSVLAYQAGDLPGQNPFFTAVREYWDYYVQGRNPYDSFTGRGALDQTAVDARQADAELAKRTVSNVTGGIGYRFKPERPGEKLTTTEEFLNLPFVSNLLGRWVRVSNRGLDDMYRGATEPVQREQAALRLVGEEMIGRTLRGDDWTPEQTSLISESPYLANYLVQAMPRVTMQADSPFLRQLQQAQSQAEKLAIIEIENERQRKRQERLRSAGGIINPIQLPPEPARQR